MLSISKMKKKKNKHIEKKQRKKENGGRERIENEEPKVQGVALEKSTAQQAPDPRLPTKE